MKDENHKEKERKQDQYEVVVRYTQYHHRCWEGGSFYRCSQLLISKRQLDICSSYSIMTQSKRSRSRILQNPRDLLRLERGRMRSYSALVFVKKFRHQKVTDSIIIIK